MKRQWLHDCILRVASLLAPRDQRAEWLGGWQSELWYIPRHGATWFCLGAFPDALWLRRNNLSPVKRTGTHLEPPLSCLGFLAALAAASIGIAFLVPGPKQPAPWPSHLKPRDIPMGCMAMLAFSCLLLPITRLVIGANRYAMPAAGTLRRAIFFALKTALIQPVMLCGFVVLLWAGPLVPIVPQLAMFSMWILTFRWIILDQRRRCPACLRLLTNPVRIGDSSHTFLEWYGAESICARGHGLQQIPESLASYSGKQEWLKLDDSWSGLFSEIAGAGRR